MQELQIQLKHASAPAEQLVQRTRAAEQEAAAREARLEEQHQARAELAARHAAQALQTLRAQMTASFTEADMQVRPAGVNVISTSGGLKIKAFRPRAQQFCGWT